VSLLWSKLLKYFVEIFGRLNMTINFLLKKRRYLVYVELPIVGELLTSCISHDPIQHEILIQVIHYLHTVRCQSHGHNRLHSIPFGLLWIHLLIVLCNLVIMIMSSWYRSNVWTAYHFCWLSWMHSTIVSNVSGG